MNYKEIFPNKHAFLAVIHAEGISQAIDNSRIAIENGADGIFLIGHRITTGALLSVYNAVEQHIPEGIWVGLNLLRERVYHDLANTIPLGCPGVWTDESGIFVREKFLDTSDAKRFKNDMKVRNPDILWFGGVAFKGQPPPKDVANLALVAKNFMDVVTTSGTKTGSAPDVEKLQIIRGAIGDHPLANASGTTPENVHLFKPYVDCFLVATGISKSFTELDPVRVRAMADAIKS